MDGISQGFQMPNVFVIPPEEDKVPVWCCFNAAQPMAPLAERNVEVKDIVVECFLDEAMDDDPSSPNLYSQPSQKTQSVVQSLMNREYNIDHATADTDSDAECDSEYGEATEEDDNHPHHGHLSRSYLQQSPMAEAGNDSDVIEVIKVSRRYRGSEASGDQQPPLSRGLKRTATLRAKASKALRSLSGAFRSSKSKPRVEDVFSSRSSSRGSSRHGEQLVDHEPPHAEQLPPPPVEQAVPRTPSARMSRRFSQIFDVSTVGRSCSSTIVGSSSSIATEDHPPTASPSEPSLARRSSTSSRPTTESTSRKPHPLSSHRTSVYQDTQSSSTSPMDLSQHEDDHPPRAQSPQTLGTSSRSTNRRFSRANLKTLFSFSSNGEDIDQDYSASNAPSPSQPSMDSGRTTPTLKRKSSSLPSTSSNSSAGPHTPTSTEGKSPPAVQVGLVTRRASIIFDEDVHFEEFGKGLGILPSESSQPSSLSRIPEADRATTTTPLFYHRYSSSSYLSSVDTTSTVTIPTGASTLPPIRQFEYVGPVLVEDVNVGPVTKEDGDISFEMRLDSLHFDSLSFDADHFALDLEEIRNGR